MGSFITGLHTVSDSSNKRRPSEHTPQGQSKTLSDYLHRDLGE